jgi:hypothetical protein
MQLPLEGIPMPVNLSDGLTTAEIEQYHRDGFLGPFTAFTREEMNAIRPLLLQDIFEGPSQFSDSHTESRHLDSASVWELCSAPTVVNKLKSLYGPDLMVWASTLFDKTPAQAENPGEYPWHQDWWHWKIQPRTSLSMWLAVTDATRENGCVEVIPGTHTCEIPTIVRRDTLQADPAHFDESKKVPMVMRAGQFFLFNEATLHRSTPNRSDARRVGLSFRVSLPSVKSDRLYPCAMLCGTDKHGINKFLPQGTSERDPASPKRTLIEPITYTFDQPLCGWGWHPPEQDGDTWFRWTGPETTSWLDLHAPGKGACVLRIQILHAISQDVLKSLKVQVNNQTLPLWWRQNGPHVEVEGMVSADTPAILTRRVRVTLKLGAVKRFCDLQSGNDDPRQLGLAITRISLAPASGEVRVPQQPQSSAPEPVTDILPLRPRRKAA